MTQISMVDKKLLQQKHSYTQMHYITYKTINRKNEHNKKLCVQIVLNAQVSQDVGEAWEVF